MSERIWKYASLILLGALLSGVAAEAATRCPSEEGPHNCRVLNALGSPVVCEGEAEPIPAPVQTPEVVTTASASAAAAQPAVGQAKPVAPPHTAVAIEGHDVELCFPKASWDAAQEDRPCYLLGAPEEDGSGRLNLGTEGYELATCVIPNVREERGHFVVHCRRVPKH